LNKHDSRLLAAGHGQHKFDSGQEPMMALFEESSDEEEEEEEAGAEATAVDGENLKQANDKKKQQQQKKKMKMKKKTKVANQNGDEGGFISLWYPSCHDYPCHLIKTASGVTALDFSKRYSNILAVGFYSGAVGLYDISSKSAEPFIITSNDNGQHLDPVWNLSWVELGDLGELLMTISTDGRVTQWSTVKGLEHTDIMVLKKATQPQPAGTAAGGSGGAALGTTTSGKEGGGAGGAAAAAAAVAKSAPDAFISRRASGMSIDFSHVDPTVYIVSTEEGPIHRCSTSYSEQYLESFFGHMGPVYKVQYSPFLKGVFLSASADWTIRLWREGKSEALLTFSNGPVQFNDLAWSPSNATVFAAATSAGDLQLWDLAVSTLKPVAVHSTGLGVSLNSVAFSSEHPILICGGANGEIAVLKLCDMEHVDEVEGRDKDSEAERLDTVVMKNVMKAGARKGGA